MPMQLVTAFPSRPPIPRGRRRRGRVGRAETQGRRGGDRGGNRNGGDGNGAFALKKKKENEAFYKNLAVFVPKPSVARMRAIVRLERAPHRGGRRAPRVSWGTRRIAPPRGRGGGGARGGATRGAPRAKRGRERKGYILWERELARDSPRAVSRRRGSLFLVTKSSQPIRRSPCSS